MEFYEFFEKIIGFIPEGFKRTSEICEAVLPWLFGFFTLATSFVGHFMHKIWNIFFFFGIGFFVPLFVLFAIFQPSGAVFWLIVLGSVLGLFVVVSLYWSFSFQLSYYFFEYFFVF